jgi:hypothetical protein
MPVTRLLLASLVMVATVVAGFAGGRLAVGLLSTAAGPAVPSPEPTPSARATPVPIPAVDVPGSDLDDLPRYGGSVRTFHRLDDLGQGRSLLRLEYLAEARLDEVRAHYVRAFRTHQWTIDDIDFTFDEWAFSISRDGREATVMLREQGGAIEVAIDLLTDEGRTGDPLTPTATPPARESPTPRPATPTPIRDDDDDDDDATDD